MVSPRRDVTVVEIGGDEVRITLGHGAIASAAWEADFNECSWRDHLLGLRVLGTEAVDEDFAESARFAAEKASGGTEGAVAEDGDEEWSLSATAKGDDLAEAAAVLTGAAGILAEGFLLDQ